MPSNGLASAALTRTEKKASELVLELSTLELIANFFPHPSLFTHHQTARFGIQETPC